MTDRSYVYWSIKINKEKESCGVAFEPRAFLIRAGFFRLLVLLLLLLKSSRTGVDPPFSFPVSFPPPLIILSFYSVNYRSDILLHSSHSYVSYLSLPPFLRPPPRVPYYSPLPSRTGRALEGPLDLLFRRIDSIYCRILHMNSSFTLASAALRCGTKGISVERIIMNPIYPSSSPPPRRGERAAAAVTCTSPHTALHHTLSLFRPRICMRGASMTRYVRVGDDIGMGGGYFRCCSIFFFFFFSPPCSPPLVHPPVSPSYSYSSRSTHTHTHTHTDLHPNSLTLTP